MFRPAKFGRLAVPWGSWIQGGSFLALE